MRIDVAVCQAGIDAELARLHARLRDPGDALHATPVMATSLPGLVFRYREVDGEFYLYVEDRQRQVLAGCTVFNRVVELERGAARYLRSPHSRYASAYQRRGVASCVYRWALHAGLCLLSGPRQSRAAHRLWMSLAESHEFAFMQLRDRALRCIGTRVARCAFDAFDTRMVLLGSGWNLERFAGATHCEMAPAPRAHNINPA